MTKGELRESLQNQMSVSQMLVVLNENFHLNENLSVLSKIIVIETLVKAVDTLNVKSK